MSIARRSISASVLAAGLLLAAPGLAHGETDLAGHWSSSALRSDGVGYSLSLSATSRPTTSYDGVLLFHFQDGRLGKKMHVGVAQKGNRLTLVMPGGSIASGKKTLKGTLGQDGSIYFAHCERQFPYVTRSTAPEMCMFQEFSLR